VCGGMSVCVCVRVRVCVCVCVCTLQSQVGGRTTQTSSIVAAHAGVHAEKDRRLLAQPHSVRAHTGEREGGGAGP